MHQDYHRRRWGLLPFGAQVTILKIHGTSGSGKTTAVRSLIDKSILTPVVFDWHYKDKIRPTTAKIIEIMVPDCPKRIFILGKYDNTCGGVDTISDVNQVGHMIDKLHGDGDVHIVYEGLLTSTYYGWLGKHSWQFADEYIYAFLDTPLELCIERVKARRKAAGNDRPFNEVPTSDKYLAINRLKKKLGPMGHRVATLEHEKPMYEQLITLLG